MYTKSKKSINVVLFFLIIIAFSNCTTTQMTISTRAYNSAVEKIGSDISSNGNGYQLTGSGSDTKNELLVTGQSYSKYSGFGTLLDNEKSIYNNYTYTDSIGNTVEFQIKHKSKVDYNKNEYIDNIEVVQCNCKDKKLYSEICGENGLVKKVTQLNPDQQSKKFDIVKTTLLIYGSTIGVTLLALLPLLAM